MNKKIMSVCVFIVAFLIAGVYYSIPTQNLIILLRCDNDLSGTLIVSTVQNTINTTVDLAEACTNNIALSGYQQELPLEVTLTRIGGESITIQSHYGDNIQVDNDNKFYLILDLYSNEPFLANVSI